MGETADVITPVVVQLKEAGEMLCETKKPVLEKTETDAKESFLPVSVFLKLDFFVPCSISPASILLLIVDENPMIILNPFFGNGRDHRCHHPSGSR